MPEFVVLPLALEINRDAIAAFCRSHPIDPLSVFGSALRDGFGRDSDVDFLVKFTSDAKVGFFDIAAMDLELTQLTGRKADLRTVNELSNYFRDGVGRSAEIIYERT